MTAVVWATGCLRAYQGEHATDAAPAEAAPCEPPGIRPGGPCAQQCLDSKDDRDCDGLKDAAQDPWPGTCNSLLLAEEFTVDPRPRWGVLSEAAPAHVGKGAACGQNKVGGAQAPVACRTEYTCIEASSSLCEKKSPVISWTCGTEKLTNEPYELRTQAAQSLTQAAYLLEMRVRIDSILSASQWAVGEYTNKQRGWFSKPTDENPWEPSHHCEIWMDSTYVSQPGLHIVDTTTSVSTGCWTSNSSASACNTRVSPGASIRTGEVYLLQTWFDQTDAHCRLLDATGQKVIAHLSRARHVAVSPLPTIDLAPTVPGTIQVVAGNAVVTVDHVRVFAAPK